LHAPQSQGFVRLPVDDLDGMPVLAEAVRCKGLENLVVVSPDMGFVKQARKYADFLGTGLAIGDKERRGHDEQATVLRIIGDVEGKTALIVDDVVISGGTLVEAARQLVAAGATAVYAAVTHGVFSKDAMQQIMASPIQRLFVTDSIETQPVAFCDKIEVVSVAPLLAEAIRRIHYRESISVLFPL
ncbi:ribose-phosphate pyrophosphokinase, partial [Litorilinea aerophila]